MYNVPILHMKSKFKTIKYLNRRPFFLQQKDIINQRKKRVLSSFRLISITVGLPWGQ